MHSFAQGKFILQDSDQDKIKFKLINNLIVIPVNVNGVELAFILDTGVSKPIIFNFFNLTEELQINQTELIYLRGLGEGESVEALRSRNNVFRIGQTISISQDLYAIFDPSINFTPQLGIPIHGIIGYDFFKDFIVEINYSTKFLKIYDRDTYEPKKCKKCKTFDLDFYNFKPYITIDVVIDKDKIPVKLLIDSGGSDSIWLFEDDSKQISLPEKYFVDYLGRGLSGSVYGKRSSVEALYFGDFKLNKVNAAFPDLSSISFAKKFEERNGSLGGEVLKRFNVTFDYANRKITLKKNKNFRDPFYYNKSGIVLEHDGVRVVKEVDNNIDTRQLGIKSKTATDFNLVNSGSYKYVLASAFTVVQVREDSPAEKAGLLVGDVILSVNNKHAHSFSLQEITQLFYGENGKRIKILIDRKGVQMRFDFRLQSIF